MKYLPMIKPEDIEYQFGYRSSVFRYMADQGIEAALFMMQSTKRAQMSIMPDTLYAVKEISDICRTFGIKPIWGFYMDFRYEELLHKLVIPKNERTLTVILEKLITCRSYELYVSHFGNDLKKNRNEYLIAEHIDRTANDFKNIRDVIRKRRKARKIGQTSHEVNCWADDFESCIGELDFVYKTVSSYNDYLGDYTYSAYKELKEEGVPLVTFPRIAHGMSPYNAEYISPQRIAQGMGDDYPRWTFDGEALINSVDRFDASAVVDGVWS